MDQLALPPTRESIRVQPRETEEGELVYPVTRRPMRYGNRGLRKVPYMALEDFDDDDHLFNNNKLRRRESGDSTDEEERFQPINHFQFNDEPLDEIISQIESEEQKRQRERWEMQ